VTPTDEERELVARQMPAPDPYVAALLRLLDAARVEVGALLRVLDETRASWDREHAASQGIAAERDAARAQVVELRRAGAMLANCAFNLKQRESLDADTRRSLAESQEAWDAAALAALAAIPTTPTPAVDVTGPLRAVVVSGDLRGRVLVALEQIDGCTDCGETFSAEEQRAFDPKNNDHCPKCGAYWSCTTYYGDPEYRITASELEDGFVDVVPTPAVDAEELALMREVCEADFLRDSATDTSVFEAANARRRTALNKLRAYRERGR
jgi:hypothetical protein